MTTTTSPAAAPSRTSAPRARGGWLWITLSSLAIVAFAVGPYLTSSLAQLASSRGGLADNYAHRPVPVQVAFYVHVLFGGIALMVGPVQFLARLRQRRPALHQATGRVYLIAVAVAGIAGLGIAPVNRAGFDGFFGFGTLAVLWLYTALRAYRAARGRDFASHQAWMIRNFALTYAAVTLRAWTGLLIVVQVPFLHGTVTPEVSSHMFANAYWAVPFLCWVPNIVVAEWLVRRRGLPGI
ncbi:MAG: DUF2306 domain-containing protein [Actinobacteria bacterium]|nr:DUF2306 domain-containing protein [Actinomycetota bacterium]MBI3688519.1 DUF2306 domain-containing protein [Actinomycetota bacterium]